MTLAGFKPDLCWTGSGFEKDCVLWVENGRIVQVTKCVESASTNEVTLLKGQAFLPGMVNAHSHAWHRGLRDVPEGIPSQAPNNFWGWRESMYQLASQLAKEPQKFKSVCRAAFEEMVGAGITTVGEFHYLHHTRPRGMATDGDGENEPRLYDLDEVILEAAHLSGIRIVLLETFYEMAGLTKETRLNKTQQHFLTASQEEFWGNWEELRRKYDERPRTHFGVAAHSVRAVTVPNLVALAKHAGELDIPFHIHLEEQPKEIEDCLAVHKETPSQLLLQNLANIDHHFTGVHCTHTSPDSIEQLGQKGANICITPVTEGRLGDGIFGGLADWASPTEGLMCCLGSDCNNRICFAEEMRWAVYLQQVKALKRGLPGRTPHESSVEAFKMATKHGSRSLGLEKLGGAGSLGPGSLADFFTIDLDHPSLKSCHAKDNLLDAFIFGSASDAVVRSVWVGGQLVHSAKLEIHKPLSLLPNRMNADVGPVPELDGSSVAMFDASLMAVESISGNERLVGLALEQWCTTEGWHTHKQFVDSDEINFNLLITPKPWKLGDPGPPLILNSHMDTVPPFIPPTLHDNCQVLRGRGSADAKGQISAMTFAAKSLDPNLRSEIGFLWVTNEETSHLGAKVANGLGLQPEFVICGEPTELKMAKAQKGILKVKIQASGRAGHSGYPELYESATDKLLEFLGLMRKFNWPISEQLGPTTVNVGVIEGGVAANVIPGSASAIVMFRCVSEPEGILAKLMEMAEKTVVIEVITKNNPFMLSTLDGYESDVVCFNTDLPYFQFQSNPKCYLFGPGSIKICHSPDELIYVKELEEGADMLAGIITTLLNQK